MTPDQIEAERTKFEAWYRQKWGRVPRRDGDGYWHGSTTYSWIGYLARAEEQYASEAAERDLRIRQQGILQIRCEEDD